MIGLLYESPNLRNRSLPHIVSLVVGSVAV